MNDKNIDQTGESEHKASEIVVNDYGATADSTVVVDEETRTVLLTDKETIVIEKEPMIDSVPKNRPRKIYAGMWGQAEIATVGIALLAILTVVLVYVLLVLPKQKEIEADRAKRDQLERELVTARARYGSFTTTEAEVAKLITSATDFETRFLPAATNGKTALYQRLNGLISAYGLINTSGPDYAPLEIVDLNTNRSSQDEGGRTKFQSIFPGTYVTVTVEGSYQNLRRFIREVETSQQFVVVSAVELEPSENSEQQKKDTQQNAQTASLPPSNPNGFVDPNFQGGAVNPVSQPIPSKVVKGKTYGETVSLRLEMAAYFRRPNFVPPTPETMAQ